MTIVALVFVYPFAVILETMIKHKAQEEKEEAKEARENTLARGENE